MYDYVDDGGGYDDGIDYGADAGDVYGNDDRMIIIMVVMVLDDDYDEDEKDIDGL